MILYLFFAALFVYAVFSATAKDSERAHDRSDRFEGYLMVNASACNITATNSANSNIASQTFTSLIHATQDIGREILFLVGFRGVEAGFLPVRGDVSSLNGKMALLIRTWGYSGIFADRPLSPLDLNAPLRYPHSPLPQYTIQSQSGGSLLSLMWNLQAAVISMAPKPLLNTTAIWESLTAHLSKTNIAAAHNYTSPIIVEI